MKLKVLPFLLCLTLLLIAGGTASGQCDSDDGNNNRKNATPMEYVERVRGVVCPDDPFDFYVLRIAEGDSVSGTITFSSYSASTVLNIGRAESGKMFVEGKATTEDNLQFTIDVPEGKLPPGTYYARVSFESGADYDHEYMLYINLTCKTSILHDGKFAVDESPKFKPAPMDVVLPGQPWPMYRGNAQRTGRSTFPGPAALSKVELVRDLQNKPPRQSTPPDDPSTRMWNFQGPVIGSPGYFRCVTYRKGIEELVRGPAPRGYLKMTCDLSTGELWISPTILSMEICLDYHGNVCSDGYGDIVRTGPTPNSPGCVCSAPTPYRDTINYVSGYRYLTNLVGKRLYLHRGLIDGPFYVTAFDYSDEAVWHSKKFDHPMIGMMEDRDGNLYVRVHQEGLYKVGLNGEVLWNVLGQPQMQQPTGLAPTDKSGRFGPICGNDGRIWVSTRTLASSPTEYHVFNADGSEYKSGNFGAIINPCVCCYGHDGRFYVGTNTLEIRCYNDWDEMVWSTPLVDPNSITGPTSIQDMVMDSNNMIYVLLYRTQADTASIEIFAINPNGQIVSNTTINLPVVAGPENELAIGDGKKLVLLNSGGFLYVISALQIDPGVFKSKIHLEAIDD